MATITLNRPEVRNALCPAMTAALLEATANAERDALRVRGDGDAVATQTYAKAYSKDPEFYAFYRSLQAYERSLGKDGDLLVISPDGEFFKYLKDPSPGKR